MNRLKEILNRAFPEFDFDRTDLISGGYIDSLMFVNIISVLEKETGKQIDLLDMEPDYFESLESMASYLASMGIDLSE